MYMVYCCGVQHDPLLQFVHEYETFQTTSPGLFHLDQFLTVDTTSGEKNAHAHRGTGAGGSDYSASVGERRNVPRILTVSC
jgi:hypothetical protein